MKRAIITGASSGIGRELARELTRRGYAVALLARRADLLEELQAELMGSLALPCDVADQDAVNVAVRSASSQMGGPFDVAIANAGIGRPSHAAKFNAADARLMLSVNVLGMMYLFEAVMPSMIARRSGTFAGIASIAGLRGLPGSGVYSATKAAMQAFLEASRIEVAPHGVRVTIVNPGFVATPMTAKNHFPMPFIVQAPAAAMIIANGIERGVREVEFPLPMAVLMRMARLLPNALFDRLTASLAWRQPE